MTDKLIDKAIGQPITSPYIFDENFLLQNETARILYHDHAEKMPVIDYHCHLPAQQIAENYSFSNMTDIWLRGDHYKWRAMRTLGVDERYITGAADDEEKFIKWAEIVPQTLRNPLFHWTHLELKNPFKVETYLDKDNAKEIYDHCNKLLQKPEFTARGLLKHFRVTTVCTTDDPCDPLNYHQQIRSSGFEIKILPAFRPDKALDIGGKSSFRAYVKRLSGVSNLSIHNFETLIEALQNRVDYFHENGCRLADHGLSYIPFFDLHKRQEADQVFQQVLNENDNLSEAEKDNFSGLLLYHLCQMYYSKKWTQQFHLGALRNTNTAKLKAFGPDTGFDSMGDYPQALGLVGLLDQLEQAGNLAQTILYNNNPADNELFAAMVGNFNEGPGKGKLQYGSAWWFLDQLDGMEKQINALSNMSILSCFLGMLTDSRSFLSYSRHDYFRRLLCNIFGKDVEAGLLPNDERWIGKIIEDICYNNARTYFKFE